MKHALKTLFVALVVAGLCAGTALALDSVTSGFWDDGATWVGGIAPSGGADVVITDGNTVTIRNNTTIIIKSLTIETNGVLTHSANSTTALGERYKVILNIGIDLTIDLGGTINVDNKGYYAAGPGYLGNYSGASYGGRGTSGRPSYGSIIAPINIGSGCSGATAGYGGGAAQLTVGGTTTLNGIISASDLSSSTYGASGGSVFLTTGTLTGNGTIRANGRNGGGGGRVAVVLTGSANFGDITMQAYAGGTANSTCGTIYQEHENHQPGKGRLTVDNNNNVVANPPTINTLQNGSGASSHEFAEIVLTNGAVYALDADDTLIITNTVIHSTSANRKQGIYVSGGTLTVPAAFNFTNYYIAIGSTNSTFAPTASLTVGTNATMKFDVPWTVDYPVTLEDGGWLSHSPNASTEAYKLNLTLNAGLNIETGGQVNVDNTGYNASGPGFVSSYVGSSYGGQGSGKGLTYGSITAPTNCGSGSKEALERGGGSARLTVTGTTTVYGVISASDMGANAYGSSGGSVFLTTGVLIGNGTIRANSRKKGGGGRIAVILTNSTDFGTIGMQAYGGPNGGAAGTIYTEIPAQGAGNGTLLIDAYNRVATVTTLISGNVTDTTVGTVVITNKAKFKIAADQFLTVNGSWLNTATFDTTDTGATVVFSGTNTATITGDNTFYNLVCTNTDKILYFEDGKTNTVDGTLTLANAMLDSTSGSASWFLKASANTHSVSNVTAGRSDARPGASIQAFDSTNEGGNFNWVFAESGFATNIWLGTEDSDWGNGNNWSKGRATIDTDSVVIPITSNDPLLNAHKVVQALVISNGATMDLAGYDLTVNENTQVSGTLTATGAETLTLSGDLDFSGSGNFNPSNSTVLLTGTNAQTVVSAGNAFYQLTIDNDAAPVVFSDAVVATNILNVGTLVTFAGPVTVAVAFQTQGDNVTFEGAVDVDTFHNASGTLVFGDTLTASSFYSENGALVFTGVVATATFTNWAGDLTFHDDFSSDAFHCAPGGMDLTFEAGKRVTIGTCELYGSGGNLIRLRSSASSHWNLDVTNWSNVRHVDVQYSDANTGETIYPLASTDSGNNPNWDFGDSYQTWVGAASAVFTNANNWVPVGTPDAASRVLIDGFYATAPILSGAATVTEVIVGGSITTATLTVNGDLTTLGDVTVQPNGTITHSANAASETYKLLLTVGSNLTLSAGGQINVDNKGYYRSGPGYLGNYSGSGYGGMGTGGRPTYGSITSPTNCGSGSSELGERGGGVAQLMVTGTTTVQGEITASDMGANAYGSSGGSVFLTTGTLTGNGTLRANSRAKGGGGRVAVILTNSTDLSDVAMQAYGGANGGAAGTVYTETPAQGTGNGTLLIDAYNRVATVTTLISDMVTDTEVGTVIITNKAILKIAADQSLTVNGSWLNTATFIGTNMGATVILAGASNATVQGNNPFYNLTAGAEGKTIRFDAGKTNTVNGKLTFMDDTTLLSTVDGTQWWLDLSSATGTQEVGRVTVKDSNASLGQEILAGNGSTDLKNNENWSFPAKGSVFTVR